MTCKGDMEEVEPVGGTKVLPRDCEWSELLLLCKMLCSFLLGLLASCFSVSLASCRYMDM